MMEHIEGSLRESVDCYRELLELYAHLGGQVSSGAPASTLLSAIDRIEDLSRRAQTADARFQDQVAEAGGIRENDPLFSEKRHLLGLVLERNNELQYHIQTAMALIRDELCRLRHTKQALSGYHSGQATTGRKIESSA